MATVECVECGAAVSNMLAHDAWHERLAVAVMRPRSLRPRKTSEWLNVRTDDAEPKGAGNVRCPE